MSVYAPCPCTCRVPGTAPTTRAPRPRLGLELLWVYLNHPDLVWSLVGQLPDRGVLREEAVPVGPPVAGAYRTEERRDGRRGEYGLRGDPVSSTVERSELAREHVHGTDEQHRVGVLGLESHLREVHPPLEQPLERLERRDGKVVVVVGADDRHRYEVLEATGPQDPGVDDLLVGRGGGVVAPESVKRLRSPCRIAP